MEATAEEAHYAAFIALEKVKVLGEAYGLDLEYF